MGKSPLSPLKKISSPLSSLLLRTPDRHIKLSSPLSSPLLSGTHTDSLIETRTSICVFRQTTGVVSCFTGPSLTVRPTQDNTLCSLPTGLINTCCRNSTDAYFSWDYSSGNLLILCVCVCVCLSACLIRVMESPAT